MSCLARKTRLKCIAEARSFYAQDRNNVNYSHNIFT